MRYRVTLVTRSGEAQVTDLNGWEAETLADQLMTKARFTDRIVFAICATPEGGVRSFVHKQITA